MTAGYWMIVNQYLPAHNYMNSVLSGIMMVLSVIVMFDAGSKWYRMVFGSPVGAVADQEA